MGLICATALLSAMFGHPTTAPTGGLPIQTQPEPPVPKPATETAVLNQPYIMGAKGSELIFTLKVAWLAEYFAGGDENYVAGKNERLLVLYFDVLNPNKQDVSLGSSTFQFNYTSPRGENFPFRGYLLRQNGLTHLSQSLRNKQKISCAVVIPIDSQGEISDLQIERGEDFLLRYNLTGKSRVLGSPFFSGINLKSEMTRTTPVAPMTAFNLGGYSLSYMGTEYTDDKIMGYAPDQDHVYMVVKFAFGNPMNLPVSIGFQYFTLDVKLSDNATAIAWNRTLLKEKSDEYLSQEIAPSQAPVIGRYYVAVPKKEKDFNVKLIHVGSTREFRIAVPNP